MQVAGHFSYTLDMNWLGAIVTLLTVALIDASAAPEPNVCTSPIPNCHGPSDSYGFNPSTYRCERTCSGAFDTLADCHNQCRGSEKANHVKDHLCFEGPMEDNKPNICRAAFRKYTFNVETLKCEKFTYGGCHGGRNLFDTASDCISNCTYLHGEQDLSLQPRSLENDDPIPPQARSINVQDSEMTAAVNTDICSLPKKTGNCRAAFRRYHYHAGNKQCQQFIYGGCGGNGNNFKSLKACQAACDPMARPEECPEDACDRGELELNTARGCLPIYNNKDDCCPSDWDCQTWNQALGPPSSCFYRGRFYDHQEKLPKSPNVFCTDCHCFAPPEVEFGEIVCSSADIVEVGRDESRTNCTAEVTVVDNWQDCNIRRSVVTLPRCSINTNDFCELEGEQYSLRQVFRPSSQPCKVCHCTRGWKNNVNLEENDQFCRNVHCDFPHIKIIKGCKPIYNNHSCCPSKWECGPQAKTVTTDDDAVIITNDVTDSHQFKSRSNVLRSIMMSICLLPKKTGPCRAMFLRWHFDPRSGSCKRFIYGGCSGNDNNFDLESECLTTCARTPRVTSIGTRSRGFIPPAADPLLTDEQIMDALRYPRCAHPIVSGRCYAYFNVYGFDQSSGECKNFIYGGCGGNSNRFMTLDECKFHCQIKDISKLRDWLTKECVGKSTSSLVLKEENACKIISCNNGIIKVDVQGNCDVHSDEL